MIEQRINVSSRRDKYTLKNLNKREMKENGGRGSFVAIILFSFKDISVKLIYSLIKIIGKVCRFGGRKQTDLGKSRCFFSPPFTPKSSGYQSIFLTLIFF